MFIYVREGIEPILLYPSDINEIEKLSAHLEAILYLQNKEFMMTGRMTTIIEDMGREGRLSLLPVYYYEGKLYQSLNEDADKLLVVYWNSDIVQDDEMIIDWCTDINGAELAYKLMLGEIYCALNRLEYQGEVLQGRSTDELLAMIQDELSFRIFMKTISAIYKRCWDCWLQDNNIEDYLNRPQYVATLLDYFLLNQYASYQVKEAKDYFFQLLSNDRLYGIIDRTQEAQELIRIFYEDIGVIMDGYNISANF